MGWWRMFDGGRRSARLASGRRSIFAGVSSIAVLRAVGIEGASRGAGGRSCGSMTRSGLGDLLALASAASVCSFSHQRYRLLFASVARGIS